MIGMEPIILKLVSSTSKFVASSPIRYNFPSIYSIEDAEGYSSFFISIEDKFPFWPQEKMKNRIRIK
jgi:hypothetical protein